MTTVDLPDDLSALAFMVADKLRAERAQIQLSGVYGTPAIGPNEVRQVLAVLAELNDGPRYEAVAVVSRGDREHYRVVDRRTGASEGDYHGYFAGQDARNYAMILNGYAKD